MFVTCYHIKKQIRRQRVQCVIMTTYIFLKLQKTYTNLYTSIFGFENYRKFSIFFLLPYIF